MNLLYHEGVSANLGISALNRPNRDKFKSIIPNDESGTCSST